MYNLQLAYFELLKLFVFGGFVILLCLKTGSIFDFLCENEKRYAIVNRFFFGLVALSSIFSVVFFGFKTIFFPLLVAFLFFFFINRKRIIWNDFNFFEYLGVIMVFLILFIFRVFISIDFKTGNFGTFFKDDYFYILTFMSSYYSSSENTVYEISNKISGLPFYYQPYHYISFALLYPIKFFLNTNASLLYHFFAVPFFQTFAFMGLYSVGRKYNLSNLIVFFSAFVCLSSLRYNLWDEFILQLIPSLSKGYWFKNFYSIQFLNSGFGIKFCFALGILCLIFFHFQRTRVLFFSSSIIWLNPFLFLSSGLAQVLVVFRKPILFFKMFLFGFGVLGLFWLQLQFLGTRPGQIQFHEVFQKIIETIKLGPKVWVFASIGEVFNNFLNILFIPLILLFWKRKEVLLKATVLFVLAFPFVSALFSPGPIFKGYMAVLPILVLACLFWYRRFKEMLFLSLSWLVVVFLSVFSQIITDINQAFMFVIFPMPILISMYLWVKLLEGRKILGLALLLPILSMNIYLNVEESKTRLEVLFSDEQVAKGLLRKLPDSKSLSLYGSGDTSATYLFINQFFLGEEIGYLNDRFIPTIASLPHQTKANSLNATFSTEVFPISKLSKENPNRRPEILLFQKTKYPFLVVPISQRSAFTWIKPYVVDSIENPARKSIYYFTQ